MCLDRSTEFLNNPTLGKSISLSMFSLSISNCLHFCSLCSLCIILFWLYGRRWIVYCILSLVFVSPSFFLLSFCLTDPPLSLPFPASLPLWRRHAEKQSSSAGDCLVNFYKESRQSREMEKRERENDLLTPFTTSGIFLPYKESNFSHIIPGKMKNISNMARCTRALRTFIH